MRNNVQWWLAAVLLVFFCAACGDDSEVTASPASEPAATTATAAVHESHSDSTASDASAAHDHHHTHGAATTPAVEPYPSVKVRILDDPAGGWLLHSAPTNFQIKPESVSTAHVDGEGHMHLYIDGVKVMRLYGEWHQLPPLAAGTHEIRVELSSNDHSAMAIDGEIVDDTVILEVAEDEATLTTGDPVNAQGSADSPSTISLEIVGGEPVGGHQRVEVDLNSEVTVMVTSDTAEEVHVHGYDILRSVSPEEALRFSFDAVIPGVFEVELEGSHRLLAQLTVS